MKILIKKDNDNENSALFICLLAFFLFKVVKVVVKKNIYCLVFMEKKTNPMIIRKFWKKLKKKIVAHHR